MKGCWITLKGQRWPRCIVSSVWSLEIGVPPHGPRWHSCSAVQVSFAEVQSLHQIWLMLLGHLDQIPKLCIFTVKTHSVNTLEFPFFSDFRILSSYFCVLVNSMNKGGSFWEEVGHSSGDTTPRFTSFPHDEVVKNPPAKAGAAGSIPGSVRSPGGGNGNPFLREESCGRRSLVGYSPWGCKRRVYSLASKQTFSLICLAQQPTLNSQEQQVSLVLPA